MRVLFIAPWLLLLTACGTGNNSSEAGAPVEESQAGDAVESADVRGEEITYQAGETELQGYIAYDAALEGERPGVLVVHEWWGHNDYVRTRAHMLAERGYTALALDMYGEGRNTGHPADAQEFMSEVADDTQLMAARFDAAQEALEQHPTTDPEQVAAIGYCFGGAVVLNAARRGADLAGVASFHGNLGTEDPAAPGDIQAEILVLHGADDPLVPPEQVEAFKAEMEAADADYEFIAYPGAVHAFTNPGADRLGDRHDMPLRYDASADEQSWAELESFLQELFRS